MQHVFDLISSQRYWLSRTYLALSTLVITSLGCFEPNTMFYMLIQQSGDAGWYCVFALACLAIIALVDVVINDLMPDCFCFPFVRDNRHLIYMLLSLGLMSTAMVVFKRSGLSVVDARLILDSIIAATIAFSDLFYRHKK